jgi:hypothetical protein
MTVRVSVQARPFDALRQVRHPANPTATHLRRFGLPRELWNETDRRERAPHNSLNDLLRCIGFTTHGANHFDDALVNHLPFHSVHGRVIPLVPPNLGAWARSSPYYRD